MILAKLMNTIRDMSKAPCSNNNVEIIILDDFNLIKLWHFYILFYPIKLLWRRVQVLMYWLNAVSIQKPVLGQRFYMIGCTSLKDRLIIKIFHRFSQLFSLYSTALMKERERLRERENYYNIILKVKHVGKTKLAYMN